MLIQLANKMKMKLKYQIASILSDIQIISNGADEEINFVKWILFSDLDLEKEYSTTEVNELYSQFKTIF